MPAFLLDSSHLAPLAVAIPTILFFAWNPGLFRGSDKVPKRTFVLFLLATVLDIVWFVAGWKDGLQFQGHVYTQVVCALNAAWIVLLGVIILRNQKKNPSFTANLILHWLLFAWLGWFAFPYLGELP